MPQVTCREVVHPFVPLAIPITRRVLVQQGLVHARTLRRRGRRGATRDRGDAVIAAFLLYGSGSASHGGNVLVGQWSTAGRCLSHFGGAE